MADRVVLDYNNSLLKESDIKLLQGSNWLNDTLIGFWFEYLEHEVFNDKSLCLISPGKN
jgi:Ulp1 family protease